ncbi:hypothetical protein [Immundisolibacter sp.]|uniref:hypothetical protein n=1 Tax=Immundisolibacter sp. TaxID=1934948 RepID=UPI0035646FCA
MAHRRAVACTSSQPLKLASGLDHAGGSPIYMEQVVGEAVARQRELANRHAARGMQVHRRHVLHSPAGHLQQAIDLGAGGLFGSLRHWD